MHARPDEKENNGINQGAPYFPVLAQQYRRGNINTIPDISESRLGRRFDA
jgi:hypothetical protein